MSKRFYVDESENQDTIFDDEGVDDYYHLGNDTRDVNALCNLLNELNEENKKLKQQLNEFRFNFTEDFTGVDKDELYVKDTHTNIDLKRGIMWITIFNPQLNEFIKFKYRVTKQDLMREYLELKELKK